MGKPFFDQENVDPDSEIIIINDELEKLLENRNTQTMEIQTGLSFESWEHVKKCFNTYSLQHGFRLLAISKKTKYIVTKNRMQYLK